MIFKKYLFLLLYFSGFCIAAEGQEKCGTDEQYHYLMQYYPEYARLMQQKSLNKISDRPLGVNDVPDTILVVVHVIYTANRFGTFGNPPDSSIQKMINALNLTFSATYPNFPAENSGGVNIGLYFKLARTDPACHPTSGIVRINASDDLAYSNGGINYPGTAGGISHEQLAAKSYWDNTKYLNIWIVYNISRDIAAYAFYPPATKTVHDGIVIKASSINNSPLITHEMGHFFSLPHTFQGASGSDCPVNNDCNTDGDGICDTDPVSENMSSCDPADINPCTNRPFGSAVNNYLNYTCNLNAFTPMQRDRMRSALFTFRSSLLSSNTEWPAPQVASVTIASDDGDNIINKDQRVTFTPTVSGNPAIQYQWLKNNYPVSTDRVYTNWALAHGDEIMCVIQEPGLGCQYSNTIKISTNQKHVVSIYPNPVSDVLLAWTPSGDIKISRIRIFSADGKLLNTKIMDPNNQAVHSLKGQPAGIYFFEFTTNKSRDVIRVLKSY